MGLPDPGITRGLPHCRRILCQLSYEGSLRSPYSCTYAHTHAHTHTCTHAHARAHTRTHTHAHSRTHAHMRTHAHTRAHTHAHTCTHTHAHTRTRTHTCTQARTHAHARTEVRALCTFAVLQVSRDVKALAQTLSMLTAAGPSVQLTLWRKDPNGFLNEQTATSC